jgi:hypothetical protein
VVRKVTSIVAVEPSTAGADVLELPFVARARRTRKLERAA